jgi:Ca-activated chloride channel family protein
MRFLWPEMLWALLALPLLAAAYFYVLARRKKAALVYASLALPRAALRPGNRLRRHIPPLLFLLALAAALLACARPTATITLPSDTFTLVLAMDASLSMAASDVPPTRISAAQQAARGFIAGLPNSARLGIVSFASGATLVQPPTDNRQDMLDAIDRFQLQRGTATGSGLILALSTLFPDDGIELEAMLFGTSTPRFGRPAPALDQAGPLEAARKREQERPPAQPGSYANGAIILLSDGRRTTGPDPMDAARMAADRGVRVYTVGFGTLKGAAVGEEGWSYYMQIDETTLRAVAKMTAGEYFQASSATDLSQVYRNLTTRLSLERKDTEISALLAAAAALLLVAACALSILWFRR